MLLSKIVLKKETNNSGFISQKIDLSNLENGIYFIQITDSKNKVIKKVLKN